MPWQVPITVDGLEYPVTFNTEGEPTQQDYDEAVQQILSQKAQAAPEPEPETPGYLSQLGSALGLGYRQMKSGVGATFNALTGDTADVAAEMAEMSKLQREQQAAQTPEDVEFMRSLEEAEKGFEQAQGPLESIGALAQYPAAVFAQPGAAFKTAVQSAPNVLISGATSLAGYGLGGLVGGAATLETGPGAILGGLAGAAAGGALSNTLMEAGPSIFDVLNERTQGAASNMTADEIAAYLQQNPDIVDEGLKTGAIRGSVIGAVEALGVKGSGRLLTMPERAAARAVQKELMAQGVDVASKEAVDKALLDPALRASTKAAAETAKNQFSSAGNMARLAGASAIETGAAGAGELAAQAAAGQDISTKEAFLEMMGDAALSLPMAATTKALEGAKYMLNPALVSDLGKASAENLAAAGSSASAEAQEAFNEAIELTMLPFTREDIRATEMPFTREDIRATDLPFTREDIRATQLPFGREDIRAAEMPFSREDIRGISTPTPAVEEEPQTPSPEMEMPPPPQGVDMASAPVSPIITEAPIITHEEESLAAKRRADLLSAAADVAKGKKKAQVSPAVTAMVTPQPATTQENAPPQIPLEESVRQEPQDRAESREAEGPIVSDSVFSPAEGEGQEEVVPTRPAPGMSRKDFNRGMAAAVKKATQKEGVLPSQQITPQAEPTTAPEGMVTLGGVATERDLSKGEQMTPVEIRKRAVFKKDGQWYSGNIDGQSIVGGSENYVNAQGENRQATIGAVRWRSKREALAALEGMHARHVSSQLRKGSPVSAAAVDTYGIKLPEGYVKQGDLYVFQPQTTKAAAETQTPESVRVDSGAAGGVQSEPSGGSIPEVAKVSTETETTSSEKLDTVAQIDRLVQSGAKPEEMDKFVKSLSDDQFNELVASEAFDVEPKLAIKPKDTYDAKRIKRRKFVDQINATAVQARKTADQIFKEEEAELAKEIKKGEEVRRARKSVIDPAKTNIEYDKVTTAIVEAARRQLQNSGEIPNAILTRIYASPEAFLADRSNQRYFPVAYASLMAEPNVEGLYADKTTFVFASNIGVSDLDRNIAEARGISEEQAAARRVIAHENGHRGVDLFEPWELREFRSFVNRTYTTEEIDNLVRLYTEFADWRTNPVSRNEALEEIFQKKFERLVKIPTGGIWDDIVQFLKRVWRRLTGRKGDPTLDNMKDVVRLLRNAMRRNAVPSFTTKDGGEVKLSYAGEKAIENLPEERRQFMRDSLETAKAMAAAGKDSEEIRAVTGWFPGKYDGKMRWEVPDDNFLVDANVISDMLSGKRSGALVGELITHPSLFNAYPEIKDLAVVFADTGDASAQFTELADGVYAIRLNREKWSPSSMLHEIQHWIQKKEGFARGSSRNEFIISEGTIRPPEYTKDATSRGLNADQAYNRTAGEIEARDVQARKDLTPEQRKSIAPYSSENIAPEDAIVMFGSSGPQMSVAPMSEQDAEYLAAVEAGDMEKAQRMVDEAAKAAGYKTEVFKGWVPFTGGNTINWRGEVTSSEPKKPISVIKRQSPFPTFIKGEPDLSGIAGFFSSDKEVATTFSKLSRDGVVDRFFIKTEEPWIIFANGKKAGELQFNASNSEFRDAVRSGEYDSIILRGTKDEGDVYVILDSSKIKSANPVTYDDAGKVIPLSQRFQAASPDIRFSRVEYTSDFSAASSAGAQLARDTVYDDRIIEMRDAIRRAYEAMPKTNSVAVPIGELFAKTEELMPGVTQDEFSNVLQDLFEDNGAVLQEGDVVEPLTEQDRRYLALAQDEEANREELQRMVDEAARLAGYVSAVKHGTHNDFSIFDTSKGRNQGNRFEMNNWGIWTTEDDASIYGPKILKLYGKNSSPLRVQNFEEWFDDYVKHAYPSFYFKGITADELAESLRDEAGAYFKRKKDIPLGIVGTKEYRQMLADQPGATGYVKSLKERGFDSVLMEGGFLDGQLQTVRIYLDSNQLKSADPVTYDDAGNIIPLSRRFDTGADIRGRINVTTPEGRRAGFVVVMPKRAVASRVETEGEAVKNYQDGLEAIESNMFTAKFGGRKTKKVEPSRHTIKPNFFYKQASIQLVDDLLKDKYSIEDIANSVMSDEFLENIGIKNNVPAVIALTAEVKKRVSNEARSEKDLKRKVTLEKLFRKLVGFDEGVGSNAGRGLGIRSYITNDPRYRWMYIYSKAEEQLRKDRELAATRVASDLPQTAENLQKTDAKIAEETDEQVADDVEDNQDAIDLAEGEATLTDKQKSAWDRFKDAIRIKGLVAKALKAIRERKDGNKAKMSISVEARNAIFQMTEEELIALDKKQDGIMAEAEKVFFSEGDNSSNPKRKKMVATAKKRAEQGKSIEPKQESEEDEVSRAEKTAQNILKDLSERYADPTIYKDGKKPNINEMRELYKQRVKQGVGPTQMSEEAFVKKAVELGADELTAGILWKAAELEIDAREAMRQDKILQRKAVVGARADAQAHRIIFAKERLKRQSGFAGIDTNPNKDTIIQAFRDQVKNPVSLEDFVARLKSLNVSETVAKRLFTAAEREKTDLEAVKKFQAETRALEEIEIAENKASQIIYRFEEQYRQGFKNPPEGMTGKEQRDSIIRAFRDQVKNPTSFEVFAERLAKLKVGNEIAERMFLTASRERADLIRVKNLKIANRKVEIASKQASRLIYNTEERLRQGSKDLDESKSGDSINKAFRDQISEPVSEKEFKQRLEKLNVPSDVAARLFKTAAREKADLEAMEAFKALEGPDALKRMLNEMNKARPAEQTPLSKPIPWRKLLSQKASTVEAYRQRIFEAISSEESLANLDDAQKVKLADLFAQAWESKRKAILDRMVDNAISQEQAAGRLTKEGADALRSQRQKLVEDINLGILDEDRLMKHLADKFGIKSEFTEEERANIDRLLDILQDDKLNEVKRNKAAYELLEALSAATKIPIAKLLADYWVSSVLSGVNTAASIAMAVMSGGYELTTGAFRILRAGFTNPKELPAEIAASFKAMAEFLKAFGREGRLAWQYLVTGDRAFLDPSMNDVRNDLNYDSIGKTVSLAEKMAKSDKILQRVMGIWMRSVSRLLTALDSFNSGVTKAGALPIVFRQLNLDAESLKQATEKYNLQLYRDRVIERDFDRIKPTTAHDKALVDSYAKAEMMADLQEFGKFSENADFFGQQGAMTLDPTGVGGFIYSSIKSLTGGATNRADKFLAEAEREWKQADGADKTAKWLQLAFAYFIQFGAYNSANLAGLRFARFAGNKFNQGLSFIPGIGMFRMYEATVKDSKIEAKEAFTDMIMRNQTAGLLFAIIGAMALKAITDEPDDEKRGFFWNGGWANLTPDRKQQKLSAGQKEYTIGIPGGISFNYQNWPISPIMAAIGSLSDLIRFSPEQWNEKAMADRLVSAAASGVFSAGEIPALSGFQTLFGNNLSSKDPNEKRLDRFAKVMAGWGGGFVPRILKDIDFMTDPGLRKYETLWAQTASHIPVYRRYSGEEYYDILGKQIERKVWPGSREFMELETAPEYRTLGKLNSRGIWLTPANAEHRMVGKGRNKRKLTQEEADAYSLETGKGYRQMLLRYGSRLEQMPTERARAFLMDKADEVRDRALKKIVR